MESKARILGHGIHPLMIVFPLGLLSTAAILDILQFFWTHPSVPTVVLWMIGAGVLGGFAAAFFGWIDWFAIPSGTRAKRVGLMHGVVNGFVLLLFIGSFLIRYNDPARPQMLAYVLSIGGFLLSLLGGWLGGELVERLGVAVHEGANLNAPNSLTTSPPIVGNRSSADA
jgi:uncharacterized membrane protein